jgi:hypothetical protein
MTEMQRFLTWNVELRISADEQYPLRCWLHLSQYGEVFDVLASGGLRQREMQKPVA